MDTKDIRLLMEIQHQVYPCNKKNLELRTVLINNILGGRTHIRPRALQKVTPLKEVIHKTVIVPLPKTFDKIPKWCLKEKHLPQTLAIKVIKNRVDQSKTHRFIRTY